MGRHEQQAQFEDEQPQTVVNVHGLSPFFIGATIAGPLFYLCAFTAGLVTHNRVAYVEALLGIAAIYLNHACYSVMSQDRTHARLWWLVGTTFYFLSLGFGATTLVALMLAE